jgi:hypothetical protein
MSTHLKSSIYTDLPFVDLIITSVSISATSCILTYKILLVVDDFRASKYGVGCSIVVASVVW